MLVMPQSSRGEGRLRDARRVAANTRRILELLDRHRVRATFFVFGWIAERHPELVREIHACGHEIGSHGYWHRLMTPAGPVWEFPPSAPPPGWPASATA